MVMEERYSRKSTHLNSRLGEEVDDVEEVEVVVEDGLVAAAVSVVLEEEVQEAEVRAAVGKEKQITNINKKKPRHQRGLYIQPPKLFCSYFLLYISNLFLR